MSIQTAAAPAGADTTRRNVAEEYRGDVQATYRYLRLAIILLTVMLGVAVAIQIVSDGGDVLPSVSAYYYTPARAVFVSALCAIGVCMIVHRGRSDLEDVLLNFAGYLAFFVAFVPTPARSAIASDATAVVPADLATAVGSNTWAILTVGVIAFGLELFVVPKTERAIRSAAGRIAHAASAVAFVGLGAFFLLAPVVFLQRGHGVAAIGLFIGIVGVVGINAIALGRALRERGADRRAQLWNRYTIGFGLMLVSAAVVVVAVRPLITQWVFVLEALLIFEFLVFWVVQTAERWRVPDVRQDELVPG